MKANKYFDLKRFVTAFFLWLCVDKVSENVEKDCVKNTLCYPIATAVSKKKKTQ